MENDGCYPPPTQTWLGDRAFLYEVERLVEKIEREYQETVKKLEAE